MSFWNYCLLGVMCFDVLEQTSNKLIEAKINTAMRVLTRWYKKKILNLEIR